jgi:DHHC palmitoyltransferase
MYIYIYIYTYRVHTHCILYIDASIPKMMNPVTNLAASSDEASTVTTAAIIQSNSSSNHTSSGNKQVIHKQQQRRTKKQPRRTFVIRLCPLWSMRAQQQQLHCCTITKRQRLIDVLLDRISWVLEWFVYCIGPVLIVLALSIIALLSYTFFKILVPMLHSKYIHHPFHSGIVLLHCTVVLFILSNVLFNYICCVVQKHNGTKYNQVLYELASVTNMTLPSTANELASYRRELMERLTHRMKQQHHHPPLTTILESNHATSTGTIVSEMNPEMVKRRVLSNTVTTSNCTTSVTANTTTDPLVSPPVNTVTTTISPPKPNAPIQRAWMLLGPYEWGYCSNSHQVKPPRAHYDHVTKCLILNLDHYCPWMFNASTFLFMLLCT